MGGWVRVAVRRAGAVWEGLGGRALALRLYHAAHAHVTSCVADERDAGRGVGLLCVVCMR